MRVITGKFKNKKLLGSSSAHTHPMSEKIRGAVFDILGPIDDLRFADLYAGTGLVGIEALSRGATFVEFVENNNDALSVIRKNVAAISQLDNVKITQNEVEKWVESGDTEKYNIIVADPPYDQVDKNTLTPILSAMHKRLKPHGIVILSHPGRTSVLDVDGAVVVKERSFGNSALSFYRFE